MKIAHVSTFPETPCGIAFYASDLIESLPTLQHAKYALHYGCNSTPDATGNADVSDVLQLERLARHISDSDCDVVSLQHEFGIWGGANGEHIFPFLDAIQKPVVSTLHTTFRINDRPAIQTSILRRLIEQSATSVVLTNDSRDTFCRALAIPADIVSVIPHGVPDIRFSIPHNPTGQVHGWQLCSIGFFRPDKGVEQTLGALALLRTCSRKQYRYVIAGSSQPQFDGQVAYRKQLDGQISRFDLSDSVTIDDRFLSRNEQIELIQRSHAGVFAYQTPFQCSSGTIPLVLSAGRPVVCTPFEFAHAKKTECGDAVVISRSFGSESIAEAIELCFASEPTYRSRASCLRGKADLWNWRTVGLSYGLQFARAKSAALR